MAKELSDEQKAEKRVKANTAHKLLYQRMTEEEKEHLLAKQRTARRKRRAEGKIPHRPHLPRTGIALAKQQETQRVYQAGVRRKLNSSPLQLLPQTKAQRPCPSYARERNSSQRQGRSRTKSEMQDTDGLMAKLCSVAIPKCDHKD